MPCQFDFLFYSVHQPGTYVEPHKHNCYELVYYVTGSGTMNLSRDLYRYGPNTLTLTRPGHLHDERHDTETEVIFIGFSYDDYPVSLANGIYLDDPNQAILPLLLKMKQEMLDKKQHFNLKLDLLVQEIIVELDRSGKRVSESNDKDPLLYSRQFIDENYSLKIDMQTLAQIAGYSYDYFRHLFKHHTGLSPVQYLIRRRIEQAKLELVNTDKKITSIAMDCGFSTPSQFSKLFKEAEGELPHEYRKQGRTTAADA